MSWADPEAGAAWRTAWRVAPPADLDGDGSPDVTCGFAWNTIADLGARAHEACHTAQQQSGAPAARACGGPGAWMGMAADAQKDASADCWNQALRALGGTAAYPTAGRVCTALGAFDSDGLLDMAARACMGLGEPGAAKACGDAVAWQKSRHDAAMAAIQNTR